MSTLPTGPTERREAESWHQRNWLAFAEFGIVALVFLADEKHLVPISKTPFLLLLGWISIRVRGLRWRNVGLTLNRDWLLTLTLGVGAGLLMEAFELFVSQPLLIRLTGNYRTCPTFKPSMAISSGL
jgi:CAAX protease family protein